MTQLQFCLDHSKQLNLLELFVVASLLLRVRNCGCSSVSLTVDYHLFHLPSCNLCGCYYRDLLFLFVVSLWVNISNRILGVHSIGVLDCEVLGVDWNELSSEILVIGMDIFLTTPFNIWWWLSLNQGFLL